MLGVTKMRTETNLATSFMAPRVMTLAKLLLSLSEKWKSACGEREGTGT